MNSEEVLSRYEKDQKEFENHPVWKILNCKPEEFFEAVGKHVASLNIPPEKWDRAYRLAREASKIRSAERRQVYGTANLRLIGSLKA